MNTNPKNPHTRNPKPLPANVKVVPAPANAKLRAALKGQDLEASGGCRSHDHQAPARQARARN